jgi:hypothetical protein
MDKVIATHFIREGRGNVARTFVEVGGATKLVFFFWNSARFNLTLYALTLLQESGVDFPHETQEQFKAMHEILDAIKRNDLGPALTSVVHFILLDVLVLVY